MPNHPNRLVYIPNTHTHFLSTSDLVCDIAIMCWGQERGNETFSGFSVGKWKRCTVAN